MIVFMATKASSVGRGWQGDEPKDVAVFTAVLPQFLGSAGNTLLQLLVLNVAHMFTELTLCVSVGMFAGAGSVERCLFEGARGTAGTTPQV
ncbi:hypothetical protein [Corynebacterium heidelbergense]|uniref:hypothetical protein n=1 Tax=Corynebacterium heidelbergense TaxID=2055947 RepID=UPI00105817A6|nr:hypothetical protein [Corynebacterium heidelbergense]